MDLKNHGFEIVQDPRRVLRSASISVAFGEERTAAEFGP
jgi:hypothetical protein